MSYKGILAQEDQGQGDQEDQIASLTDVTSGGIDDVTRGCFRSLVLFITIFSLFVLLAGSIVQSMLLLNQ